MLERTRHRLVTLIAALCLVGFALAQGASQVTNTKRITALTLAESGEGSRVTVTGDSLLDDYEAFRRGDRFYVRIPAADFIAAHPRFQGNGFEDVQVQKVGDSVVISFRLHPGANARVIGSANRLEVIFTSPSNFAVNNSATAVRNRVTRNSAGEKSPSLRVSSKARRDMAGPMPPASPTTAADDSLAYEGSIVTPPSRSSRRASQPNAVATNAAVPAPTPVPATAALSSATPYPTTSPYSSTYPPGSSTYTPAPVQPVAQTSNRSFDFETRSRAAFQWIQANQAISAGAGIAVMGLLGVVLFFLYRRRQGRRAAMAKASRVQPKYSADDELEDMLAAAFPSKSSNVRPGRNVNQDAYASWDENTPTAMSSFENLARDPRADVTYDEVVAPTHYDASSEGSWQYVSVSNPTAYKGKVQEEREVFEL